MGANVNFEDEIETPKERENDGESASRLSGEPGDAREVAVSASRSAVTMLDRWMARKMLEVVHNPPIVLKLWDGKPVTPPIENPLATLQMPPGTPVATVAIDGGRNAALLATRILGVGYPALRKRLEESAERDRERYAPAKIRAEIRKRGRKKTPKRA